MVRRSTPRKTEDDQAFPIRLRVENPWWGSGTPRWNAIDAWMQDNIGKGDFAHHGDVQRMAFYFRTTEAAQRFRDAFPDLILSDRTEQIAHLNAARRNRDYGTFRDMLRADPDPAPKPPSTED